MLKNTIQFQISQLENMEIVFQCHINQGLNIAYIRIKFLLATVLLPSNMR